MLDEAFKILPGRLGELGRALDGAMPALVGESAGAAAPGIGGWLAEIHTAAGRGAEGKACLEAGLWLLGGELDRCHRLCQEVPTAYGSAWHAAMHRREGDFWNSKYWWRRVGGKISWQRSAAELARIVAPAEELRELGRGYDPARFVDLVEQHHADAELRGVLLDVQRWEWAVLFLETWEKG